MNQQRLQQKRRKRQANRKAAQATARRRGEIEKKQREKNEPWSVGHPRQVKPQPGFGGMLSRIASSFTGRSGAAVTGDQMDSEPAKVEGASAP